MPRHAAGCAQRLLHTAHALLQRAPVHIGRVLVQQEELARPVWCRGRAARHGARHRAGDDAHRGGGAWRRRWLHTADRWHLGLAMDGQRLRDRRGGQGRRNGCRAVRGVGGFLLGIGLVWSDAQLGCLYPLALGRVPHRPHARDHLGHRRQRAHLHPALPERLLVALPYVPIGCQEPDHPRRVARLLVADAIVHHLALAEFVRA
mmetsp:Transcript_3939/g.10280  ORF Transcript_3939/g.10280 Transcript_3939/m.10280 type:complete len:204 (-) Transcript_3939:301-912(-)